MASVKSKAELIDRYVYAVVSSLPVRQRPEMERELRALIADMCEARGQGTDDLATVTEVLTELGHPRKLAAQYREKPRYVIGPELFGLYWVVLKIVGVCTLGGMTIAYFIQVLLNPANALTLFTDYLGALWSGLIQVFAWVTAAFAIMEHVGVKATEPAQKGRWHPSELPAVPDVGARIRLSGTVAGLMFTVLFFVLFVHSNLFGIHLNIGSAAYTFIPLWDAAVVQQLLPFFYAWLALFILREIIKLASGHWTLKLALYTLALDVAIFIVYVFLLADRSIWNPNFMNELLAAGLVAQDSFAAASRIWATIQHAMLPVLALTIIFENAVNFYRAMRRHAPTKERLAG